MQGLGLDDLDRHFDFLHAFEMFREVLRVRTILVAGGAGYIRPTQAADGLEGR